MLWCPVGEPMGLTNVSGRNRAPARYAAAEAALLLAATTCPVLFVPDASNPFEPHKAAFLWMAAVVACAAIASSPAVAWRRFRESERPHRLFLSGLAVAIAGLCLSAFFSEAPHLAWWGSALRRDGALTQVALLAVLGASLLVITNLSTAERLINAVVLGSVGPTVYAVAQAVHVDPVLWDLGRSQGNSTFGNWLFLAGYLAVVWPLTLGQAIIATRRAEHERWSRTPSVRAAALWLLLGVQSAALVLAGSRGPLLALAATAGLAVIVFAVARGHRLIGAWLAGLAFAAVVAVLVVAPPRMATATARALQVPSMTNPQRSALVRLILWDAVGTGLRAEIAAGAPAAIVGTGPESTIRLVTRRARPGLDQLLSSSDLVPDRAHNDTLETLATTGVAGLALQLLLMGTALAMVMVGLGLMGRPDVSAFAWFASAMLCGTAALAVWRGHSLAALALVPPAALVLSVTGWIVRRPRTVRPRDPEVAIMLAAAAAAAMVHMIDVHLSLTTIGSGLVASVALATALSLSATATVLPATPLDARPRTGATAVPTVLAIVGGWSAGVLTIGLAGSGMSVPVSAVLIVIAAWLLSLAVAGADRRGLAASAVTWLMVCAAWSLWPAPPGGLVALVSRDPMDDQVLTRSAQTLVNEAEATTDVAAADAMLADAERLLRRAQAFDPFNYQHPRNLAALARRRARRAPASVRTSHLDEAGRLYRRATDLFPSNGALWAEWANLDAERLQTEDVFAKLDRAAALGAVSEANRVGDALRQVVGDSATRLPR